MAASAIWLLVPVNPQERPEVKTPLLLIYENDSKSTDENEHWGDREGIAPTSTRLAYECGAKEVTLRRAVGADDLPATVVRFQPDTESVVNCLLEKAHRSNLSVKLLYETHVSKLF